METLQSVAYDSGRGERGERGGERRIIRTGGGCLAFHPLLDGTCNETKGRLRAAASVRRRRREEKARGRSPGLPRPLTLARRSARAERLRPEALDGATERAEGDRPLLRGRARRHGPCDTRLA